MALINARSLVIPTGLLSTYLQAAAVLRLHGSFSQYAVFLVGVQ